MCTVQTNQMETNKENVGYESKTMNPNGNEIIREYLLEISLALWPKTAHK